MYIDYKKLKPFHFYQRKTSPYEGSHSARFREIELREGNIYGQGEILADGTECGVGDIRDILLAKAGISIMDGWLEYSGGPCIVGEELPPSIFDLQTIEDLNKGHVKSIEN